MSDRQTDNRVDEPLSFNEEWLKSLGFGHADSYASKCLLSAGYSILEWLVGQRIAAQMTEEQLSEFASLMDDNYNDRALRWLETNYPGYRSVVRGSHGQLERALEKICPLASLGADNP